MRKIETDNCKVEFDDSQKTKDKVFEAVIAFFVEHESFSGECICQSDDPQIEAAPAFGNIADDILKFNVTWKD